MKRKGFISFLLVFVMAFALVFASCTGTQKEKLVLSVETLEMEQYEEALLTANKEGVEWSSDDPRTVRVEDGKLTSLKLGSATVTATLNDETASCEVTVVPSTKGRALIPDKEEVMLKVGEETEVSAVLKEDGKPLTVEIVWSSDHPEIATAVNGKITGVAEGTATVTVTTVYKGQNFAKDIAVTIADYRLAEFAAVDTGALVPLYDGDAESLGFKSGDKVYEWTTNGSGWDDRIWDAGVSTETTEYDLLVAEVKFTDTAAAGPLFWANGTPATVKFANDFIGEQGTYCFSEDTGKVKLYDNTTGEEAATWYIQLDRTYTLVVNMSDPAWIPYSVGIFKAVTVYLANPTFCSNNYARANFTQVNWPKEKEIEGLYFGQSDASQKINPIGKEFSTDAGYEKMYKFDYFSNTWGERLQVARADIPNEFTIRAKYSEYEYYGFNIAFPDVSTLNDIAPVVIWTGGPACFLSKAGTLSGEGGYEVQPDDVRIFKNGVNVTGQALESGVVYEIRVKIKTENDAYGVAVSGTDGSFYIGSPYFL